MSICVGSVRQTFNHKYSSLPETSNSVRRRLVFLGRARILRILASDNVGPWRDLDSSQRQFLRTRFDENNVCHNLLCENISNELLKGNKNIGFEKSSEC